MPTTRLNGRALDVRPDRVDLRDYSYRPPLVSLPDAWPPPNWVRDFLPAYCKSDMVLNQGSDGACTGFGLAAVVNYLKWERWQVGFRQGRANGSAPAGERAHAVPERPPLRRVAGRGLPGLELPRRHEGLPQARRLLGDALAERHGQGAGHAAGGMGGERGADAARRLLPHRDGLDRGPAGGRPRGARDLCLRIRARWLGDGQAVEPRGCDHQAGGQDRARRTRLCHRRLPRRRLHRPELLGTGLGLSGLCHPALRGMAGECLRCVGAGLGRAGAACGGADCRHHGAASGARRPNRSRAVGRQRSTPTSRRAGTRTPLRGMPWSSARADAP